MKFLVTTILSTLLSLTTLATAQYPDKIIFNGTEYNLDSNPLESYFEINPDKRPKGDLKSTALWRGYRATFEMRDSQLFVKDIQIQYLDTTDKNDQDIKWKSVMRDVFPDKVNVKVDWLSGLLVINFGKRINYYATGYDSSFEQYLLLEIDKGNYIKSKQYNDKEFESFKDRQFSAYKKTADYRETKAKLEKDGSSDESTDNFLRSVVTKYTSKILTE